jgi:hypothetical protein
VDLHPDTVNNREMGYLYEELLRKFSEMSNEEAGEHFTPREVIRLMVDLLFIEDDEILRTPGIVRTMLERLTGLCSTDRRKPNIRLARCLGPSRRPSGRLFPFATPKRPSSPTAPPTTRTRPSSRRVAVCPARLVDIDPV